MEPSDAVVTYSWTLNGVVVGATSTYTVPAGTEEGAEITVIVEDEEGNTATDTVTVAASLALESVESAGRIVATATSPGGVNILAAYFSSEMEDINPNDIEIRRVSDNKLFTVEKVTMTSDQLTATMTLTGTAAAAANTEYLQSNIPYNMIIKTEDQTLSKEFIIPLVYDDVVVTKVDSEKEKITFGGRTYTLAEGVEIDDYFDLLGKSITAEVDNKGNITAYAVEDLETVIGAFKYTAATVSAPAIFTDLVTEEEYSATTTNAANSSTKETQTVQYNDKFVAGAAVAVTAGTANRVPNAANLAWAKLVLNPDGTIRTIQGLATTTHSAYVTANDEGVIKDGAGNKINLKKYVLIEDGSLVDPADLSEGDIIYYNTTANIGYLNDDSVEGTFTKDYTTSFVFGGEEYKQAVTTIKNGKEAALTTANVKDYIDAKTELTAYTKLDGKIGYVIGEAAASTSTVNLFVTSSGTLGTGDAEGASITGFNPATEAMETYSWTGTMDGITTLQVANLEVADHTTQVPTLVKLTVSADDGTTVKKAEIQTAKIANANAFVDGNDSDEASDVETKISKSTKLIGTTNADGMNAAKSKVVIFTNPTAATTAWKATNFTVSDFASWSGYVTDGGLNGGVFANTKFYGTLSKALDFVLTSQATAGTIGLEKGESFPAFVTSMSTGTSKRIEAITPEGAVTYETFNSNTTQMDFANVTEKAFNIITLSKNFDEDGTVYSIKTATASGYAVQSTTAITAEACNGSVLKTVDDGNFDIASDCLVIKSTTKNAVTTYELSDPSSIILGSTVGIYTADGNNTVAELLLATAEAATTTAAPTITAANLVPATIAETDTKKEVTVTITGGDAQANKGIYSLLDENGNVLATATHKDATGATTIVMKEKSGGIWSEGATAGNFAAANYRVRFAPYAAVYTDATVKESAITNKAATYTPLAAEAVISGTLTAPIAYATAETKLTGLTVADQYGMPIGDDDDFLLATGGVASGAVVVTGSTVTDLKVGVKDGVLTITPTGAGGAGTVVATLLNNKTLTITIGTTNIETATLS